MEIIFQEYQKIDDCHVETTIHGKQFAQSTSRPAGCLLKTVTRTYIIRKGIMAAVLGRTSSEVSSSFTYLPGVTITELKETFKSKTT